jgi:hypothetical protein
MVVNLAMIVRSIGVESGVGVGSHTDLAGVWLLPYQGTFASWPRVSLPTVGLSSVDGGRHICRPYGNRTTQSGGDVAGGGCCRIRARLRHGHVHRYQSWACHRWMAGGIYAAPTGIERHNPGVTLRRNCRGGPLRPPARRMAVNNGDVGEHESQATWGARCRRPFLSLP